MWIEWKANEIAGPGQRDGDVDPKIRSRVEELAAKLKQDNHKVNFLRTALLRLHHRRE
jgi:hypothetical protein